MKTDHLELKVMGRGGQEKSELERALDRSADPALTGCPEPCHRKLSRVPSVVPGAGHPRGLSFPPLQITPREACWSQTPNAQPRPRVRTSSPERNELQKAFLLLFISKRNLILSGCKNICHWTRV